MKVLIFLFMITAFYGDRYGRNPTWTLRRETIVPIISKEVICFFTSILFTNQLFDKRPHQSIFPKHDNFSRRLQLEGTNRLNFHQKEIIRMRMMTVEDGYHPQPY